MVVRWDVLLFVLLGKERSGPDLIAGMLTCMSQFVKLCSTLEFSATEFLSMDAVN